MVNFDLQRTFTMEELRDNVAGRSNTIPRTTAIKILSGSSIPNKHKDLEMLLQNNNEPSTIRFLAATGLGRIGDSAAKEILNQSITSESDEQVLAAMANALGRIGDEYSLNQITQAKQRMTADFAASKAQFAISLISYRLGLEGNDIPFPNEDDFLDTPTDAFQMEISEASEEEIKICKLSLVTEPFGIELADRPAFQIKYDMGVGMALLNRDIVGEQGVQLLSQRKALVGVFADKTEEYGTYSVSYLVFSSPNQRSGEINLIATRPDGIVVSAGKARIIEPENIEFSIRAVSQLGVFAMVIEGIIQNRNLQIKTARFSPVIQNSNLPTESRM
jgi:hypothetical protein